MHEGGPGVVSLLRGRAVGAVDLQVSLARAHHGGRVVRARRSIHGLLRCEPANVEVRASLRSRTPPTAVALGLLQWARQKRRQGALDRRQAGRAPIEPEEGCPCSAHRAPRPPRRGRRARRQRRWRGTPRRPCPTAAPRSTRAPGRAQPLRCRASASGYRGELPIEVGDARDLGRRELARHELRLRPRVARAQRIQTSCGRGGARIVPLGGGSCLGALRLGALRLGGRAGLDRGRSLACDEQAADRQASWR